MLKRLENGKLSLNALDLEIFIGDLFEKCKNEHEIEWVQEQLTGCIEGEAENRLNEIEG